MPARRRRMQRSRDLAEVAQRRLDGETPGAIAHALGRSLSSTYRLLSLLEEQWRDACRPSCRLEAALQLAALDLLRSTLLEAFVVSAEPQTVTTITRREGYRPSLRTRTQRTSRDGNPRILGLISCCLQERATLLGLYDAAQRSTSPVLGIDISPLRPLTEVPDAELMAELARRFELVELFRAPDRPPRFLAREHRPRREAEGTEGHAGPP
jgi:hypothetical protein